MSVLTIIRWLDGIPFWQMVLVLLIAILAIIALLILLTHHSRKLVVNLEISEGAYMGNDMNAAIYGLMLAFLIFSMYDTSKKVEESISKEANDLVSILLNSQHLNNASLIQEEVKQYTKMLIEKQWPCMVSGDLKTAWELEPQMINPLYKRIMESQPTGGIENKFYDTLPDLLQKLTEVHRLRLLQSDFHLPVQFWYIISILTFLTLWFLIYMNPWTGFSSAIPIFIPAVVIALSLGLMISLHFPFLGPFAVSNEPFRSGYLNFESGINGVDVMPGK